jgi:hypothetical protein
MWKNKISRTTMTARDIPVSFKNYFTSSADTNFIDTEFTQ